MREPSEMELVRVVKKKDILRFEVVINILKVTNLPSTVPNGSDLYMQWKAGSKVKGMLLRLRMLRVFSGC